MYKYKKVVHNQRKEEKHFEKKKRKNKSSQKIHVQECVTEIYSKQNIFHFLVLLYLLGDHNPILHVFHHVLQLQILIQKLQQL